MNSNRSRAPKIGVLAIGLALIGVLPFVGSLTSDAAAPAQPASAATPSDVTYGGPTGADAAGLALPTDQIIIKYRALVAQQEAFNPASTAAMDRLSEAAGVPLTYEHEMSGDAQVLGLPARLPLAEVQAIADSLSALPEVESAEPDAIMVPMLTPNDPQYGSQWHYFAPGAGHYGINAPAAWDITTGSPSVVVAVIDTGITNHADLSGRTVAGYDFIHDSLVANDGDGRDNNPSDRGDWITAAESNSGYFAGCRETNSSWHGTHTAGTIGAASNNGVGVAGVNWNSKILPVRVLGKCGGYTSDIVDGMRWAAGLSVSGVPANANPAKVLNLSLGGYGACDATYQNAVDAILAAGTTIVVSAGNSDDDAVNYRPGNCNGVITVAATDRDGGRAYYSNYGSIIEVSAPGGAQDYDNDPNGVLSTLNNGTQGPVADTYVYYQGTSMAAPHVAGVAALLYARKPSLTPAEVLALLRNNVTSFPGGSTCNTSDCGSGIVNAGAAVAAVQAPVPAIFSLNPASATTGGPAFTLTVNGTGFIYGSVVRWNSQNRTTTYVSGTQLKATITLADIAMAGTASVTVFNSAPGGGTSNAVSFAVVNPVPVITWLSPFWAAPLGPDFTLTVKGTGFINGSVVRWNSTDRTTTYVGSTQLTLQIAEADIVNGGTKSVTVFNPTPGGGESNAMSFFVGIPKIILLPLVAKNYVPPPPAPVLNAIGNVLNPTPADGVSNAVSFLVGTPARSYLPFIAKNYLPPLAGPVLNAIANADGDGSYAVTWNAVAGATSYTLEEDDGTLFTSPTVVADHVTATSWSASGKALGTYFYRVRATGATGDTDWSNVQSALVTPPAAPVLNAIANADGDGSYVVTWNAVAGATSYTLEEDDGTLFTSPTVVADHISATSWSASGKTLGTYFYRVKATSAVGDSGWSDAQSALVTPPAAPVLNAIANADGDGSYVVTWNAVAGATSYTLEEDDSTLFTSPTVVADHVTAPSWSALGNTLGTYFYRVRATNAVGDSGWSDAQSALVTPPAAPVLNAIANADGDGSYVVTWNAVAGATSYTLEEDDGTLFTSPTVVAGHISATSWSASGKALGTYFYRVKATGATGDSGWSDAQSALVTPPAAPVLNAIANADGDGSYVVTWNAVAGATSYTLEEDDGTLFTSPTVVAGHISATSWSASGKALGTYFYRVKATGATGDSEWSNAQSALVTPPAAPVLNAIANADGDGSYVVTWNAVAGATSYTLEEDDSTLFTSPTVVADHVTAPSWSASGKTLGTYFYRVRATNAVGDSGWSDAQSALVTPPAAPVLNAIANADGDGSYVVTWNAVAGATSYTLEEDDSTLFTSPTVVAGHISAPSWSASGKTLGTYFYRVKATGATGDSEWSNAQTALVALVLNAIANADGDGSYVVSWNLVVGATSYTLEEDDSTLFTSPTVVADHISATSWSASGKTLGTYFYRVKATGATGDSGWSNVQSALVTPPAAPVLNAIANAAGDAIYTVSWNEAAEAISYTLEEDDSDDFSTPTVLYTGTDLSWSASKLAGTYYYRVNASNTIGSSDWSNLQSTSVRPGCQNTIQNPGFESGKANWQEFSSNYYAVILYRTLLPRYASPHGGDWAAWEGGLDDEISHIQQTISVSCPYLVYWHWIDSEEVTCGHDFAGVLVNGSVVAHYDLCIARNTGGWVKYVVNLGAYVGQMVDLQIRTETDNSLLSDLLLDDLSLQATAAAAAVTHSASAAAPHMKPAKMGPQRGAVGASSPERVFQQASYPGQ